MQDTIERSITIEAPRERVWDLVTEPGWWVPTTTSSEPGERSPGAVTVRESEKWGRFPVRVERLQPMEYAAFRWASTFPGADLTDGNTTLIEFRLTGPEAGPVEVTVLESGFAALDAPEELRAQGHQDNSGGWEEELGHLARMVMNT